MLTSTIVCVFIGFANCFHCRLCQKVIKNYHELIYIIIDIQSNEKGDGDYEYYMMIEQFFLNWHN